jgi:hypothetical protein
MQGISTIARAVKVRGLAPFILAVPEEGATIHDIDAPKPPQGQLQWLNDKAIIRRITSIPHRGYLTVWGRGEYWLDVVDYLKK